MIERLEEILKKYNELEEELTKESILNDFNKLKELSKEKSELEEIVKVYLEYKKYKKELEETKSLLKDPNLKDLAAEEITKNEEIINKLHSNLEKLLIPKDENDDKNVIMEIRGAAGGDEANIFAGDLFRMYSYYVTEKGWKIEVLNAIVGTSGGYSQIEFVVKGKNAYSFLKYESGAHRVQRVPQTESQGRIHTSTATVLVMPEVEDIKMDIKESDLKIDVFHSSGAGGQSVNTTNSAVRITHIPTGIIVECQNERSQLKNKEKAMAILKSKIFSELKHKQEQELGIERKIKVGSGDRSEKIRTYNYPQNRVTDHRINFSIMELDKVMVGHLDTIIEALITEDMKLKLESNNF